MDGFTEDAGIPAPVESESLERRMNYDIQSTEGSGYHPKRKTVEVLAHGTVNPWGHDWDEHGELFYQYCNWSYVAHDSRCPLSGIGKWSIPEFIDL